MCHVFIQNCFPTVPSLPGLPISNLRMFCIMITSKPSEQNGFSTRNPAAQVNTASSTPKIVLPRLSLAQLRLGSLHPGLRLQAEPYLDWLAQGGFGSAMAKLMAHILFGKGIKDRIHMSSAISRD